MEWQEDVWQESFGQVWEGHQMPCITALTKFYKQWKTIWGFWVGSGEMTCSLGKKKKMKPGGYLEDDWKQVVLCHWTHFSVHQSENKPSICQWGNSDPIRNGTLIAFFFITEDEVTNSDFYLPAQDAWLPESSHLKIGSWKASIFDIFMSKTLIWLSLCKSQKFFPLTLTPSPDPICQKVHRKLMKETPLSYF